MKFNTKHKIYPDNPFEVDEYLPENGIEEKVEPLELSRKAYIELFDRCDGLCEKLDEYIDETIQDEIKYQEISESYEQQPEQVVQAWNFFEQARENERLEENELFNQDLPELLNELEEITPENKPPLEDYIPLDARSSYKNK